jgi:hypothetical protein
MGLGRGCDPPEDRDANVTAQPPNLPQMNILLPHLVGAVFAPETAEHHS